MIWPPDYYVYIIDPNTFLYGMGYGVGCTFIFLLVMKLWMR